MVDKHLADEDLVLLGMIRGGEPSVVTEAANVLRQSRQAAHRRLRRLIDKGLVAAEGQRRSMTYRLVPLARSGRVFTLAEGVNEDQVWELVARPALAGVDSNAAELCHYGLTEMVNNAIDHARAEAVEVWLERTAVSVDLVVKDDGVGIFDKIATALKLDDVREAPLELVKGKFTTDPRRHTGEGVFFTSRVFDRFALMANGLAFVHRTDGDLWSSESFPEPIRGTTAIMETRLPAGRTLEQVFTAHSSGPEEYTFARSSIPIRLAQSGTDLLLSRSQARRVLNRADRFQQVTLDFAGVERIGPAFADEMFRVFANSHPEVQLKPVNVAPAVAAMINRARHHRAE